jgi:hypothetical protein
MSLGAGGGDASFRGVCGRFFGLMRCLGLCVAGEFTREFRGSYEVFCVCGGGQVDVLVRTPKLVDLVAGPNGQLNDASSSSSSSFMRIPWIS